MKRKTYLSHFWRAGTLLVATLMLAASCVNEIPGADPEPPVSPDDNQRAVLLTINNKLALSPRTPTRADGAPIATAAENLIATLDVYSFACATEDGTYTFQSHFAYRQDGTDLPVGANELALEVDGTDGAITTGLLSLKKGKFVKLFCIANQPWVEADAPKADLTTEADFVKRHTALLRADAPEDVLRTPLAMSGSQTTPLDLTDTDAATRLQVGIKLVRLAARFDVVNVAATSKFTIQSVSMGNARCGATYFPIREVGAMPADPGELITTAPRAFDDANANIGLSTGAFYAYPSPEADGGYLILKGEYRPNLTEVMPVSYKIPFRQKLPEGGEMTLNINHNHRYIITIGDADPDRLDFSVMVADWADDGNIQDYEPENKPGKVTVEIPAGWQALTTSTQDPITGVHTVNMAVETNSEFNINVAASAGLKVNCTYEGGAEGRKYDWIEVTKEPDVTTRATNYSYKFKVRPDYNLGRYPRVTVRIADVLSGTEMLMYIQGVSETPQFVPTTQPQLAPNGLSPNPNSFDAETLEAKMYRLDGSLVRVSFFCTATVNVAGKPNWIDVTSEDVAYGVKLYTLTLNDPATADTDEGEVVFQNTQDPTKKETIKLKLQAVKSVTDFTAVTGSNSLEPAADATPANIQFAATPDNTVQVGVTSLDGVTVEMQYANGGDRWLSYTIADLPATAEGSNSGKKQAITFTAVNSKLATAEVATVRLKSRIGGDDKTFTITPKR